MKKIHSNDIGLLRDLICLQSRESHHSSEHGCYLTGRLSAKKETVRYLFRKSGGVTLVIMSRYRWQFAESRTNEKSMIVAAANVSLINFRFRERNEITGDLCIRYITYLSSVLFFEEVTSSLRPILSFARIEEIYRAFLRIIDYRLQRAKVNEKTYGATR